MCLSLSTSKFLFCLAVAEPTHSPSHSLSEPIVAAVVRYAPSGHDLDDQDFSIRAWSEHEASYARAYRSALGDESALGLTAVFLAVIFAVGLWHYRSTVTRSRALRNEVLERIRAESALRESERRYRQLMEQAGDAILVTNASGVVVQVNEKATELTGYRREQLETRKLPELFPVFEKLAGPWEEPAGGATIADAELRREDGSVVAVEVSARTVGEDRQVLIVRDLTERRRAEQDLRSNEEQLRRTEKIQALGRLAGGVAHDFNNLLTAINGYAELVLAALSKDAPLRSDVEQISKAGERAASLTRQLLAFSRQQILVPELLDLNEVVADMDRMLRRVIGKDVELVTLLGDDLGPVRADPGQLEQVVLNLAVNARDAMPGGGRLKIETRNVELGEAFVASRPGLRPGPHVLLEVRDEGTGIDPKTLDHIFEPFFTTKEEHKGTGLGLSTVYGIVRQSEGHIDVESRLDEGTTFRLYFPRAEQTPELRVRGSAATLPKGDETILLVEDEPSVLAYTGRVLRQHGYDVLAASYGEEALQIVERHRGSPIRLLLTDVVMPRMGGRELAERLRRRIPELKVIFTSGYVGEGVHFPGESLMPFEFLPKPFLPQVVARKVREALDS